MKFSFLVSAWSYDVPQNRIQVVKPEHLRSQISQRNRDPQLNYLSNIGAFIIGSILGYTPQPCSNYQCPYVFCNLASPEAHPESLKAPLEANAEA